MGYLTNLQVKILYFALILIYNERKKKSNVIYIMFFFFFCENVILNFYNIVEQIGSTKMMHLDI